MKRLKLPLATTALALLLSTPAFAGDIWCGVTSEPPSQPTASATGDTSAGALDATANSETITVDPVTESALQLMLSVLSLF